jgi:hypothetical protein
MKSSQPVLPIRSRSRFKILAFLEAKEKVLDPDLHKFSFPEPKPHQYDAAPQHSSQFLAISSFIFFYLIKQESYLKMLQIQLLF